MHDSKRSIDLSRDLTCEDIVRISLDRASYEIRLSKDVLEYLKRVREEFDKYINRGGSCYGVTTGLGGQVYVELREKIDPLIILKQHATGVGDFLPREFVRGAMIILAKQLSLGFSAVNPDLILLLIEMINRNITPLIPRYGSLGASGDLAPMSYIGLSLYGEGIVESDGKIDLSSRIFSEYGLRPLTPHIKDALSVINNTAMSSSIACHAIILAKLLLTSLIITSAISLEVMATPREHLSEEIVNAKRHKGSRIVSKILRELLADSSVKPQGMLQDRYSFRTIPQVLGAFYDTLVFSKTLVEREINSSSDNPIFIDGKCWSGGNFYGVYITVSIESLAQSVVQPLIQADRRIFTILDPKLSRGLPSFLTREGDVGLMITQYTTSALLNRISTLIYPSIMFTTPTSASQEDHTSNSYNASLKTYEIVDLGLYIATIEYLVSSYALKYREWSDRVSSRVQYYANKIKDLIDKLYDKPLDHVIRTARERLLELASEEIEKIDRELTEGYGALEGY